MVINNATARPIWILIHEIYSTNTLVINIAKISLLCLDVSHNEYLEIPVYHIKHVFFSNTSSTSTTTTTTSSSSSSSSSSVIDC